MNENILKVKSPHIRLVATDIDGVWTDAKMYYTDNGEFMKAFSTYDGMAVQLLHEAGVKVAILTGESSPAVSRRAEKLNIQHVYLGEKDKLPRIKYLCARFEIELDQVAYIGDDINDLEVLKSVGISGMPSSSPILQQFTPHIITERAGGDGAFREFVDILLSHR
ncbi:MAG: HAD-IIIA family hydrolase [Candidatus Marinimicrobia bacterium]|nr:HAD-IIIA family hydrolase [Candidatus Neomarinimicrobiota bacterium]